MNHLEDPTAPLRALLDAAATEVRGLDDWTLTEALSKPLPDWWAAPGEEGFEALRDRVGKRIRRRDWRVCLELLVYRGDPAVLARLAELGAAGPAPPALAEADQHLLWQLGSSRPLAVIATDLELTPGELFELIADLRERCREHAIEVTEERLGDRLDLAGWRAARHAAEDVDAPARRLMFGLGGAMYLRPTQPISAEDESCLIVEEVHRTDGVFTRLSFPVEVGLPPPIVTWRFTFDARDEELHLLGLGLDRGTLGLARVASETEAAFSLLLDEVFPHRRGEFGPGSSYRVEWRGRLPRIERYSLRVEASAP